jgi:ribonuclease P protein component
MKKIFRLKLQRDFDHLFKRGRQISFGGITLKYAQNNLNHCRLAVIVSKKTAKSAVKRNLLRRRIGEIIRVRYLQKLVGWDIAFIPRAEIMEKDFSSLKEIIGLILEKAKIIQ